MPRKCVTIRPGILITFQMQILRSGMTERTVQESSFCDWHHNSCAGCGGMRGALGNSSRKFLKDALFLGEGAEL
jgi:hypothetical protein